MLTSGGDQMNLNDIVNLILNSSLSVVVCGYFMFVNYKFNQQLVKTLSEISTKLEIIGGKEK